MDGQHFEFVDFSRCDCINILIQIRNSLLKSVFKLFPLSVLWMVLQSSFREYELNSLLDETSTKDVT